MNTFIENHPKLVLGVGVGLALLIIGVMVVTLVTMNNSATPTNKNETNVPIVNNEIQYDFVKNNLPEKSQFLLLQAKIVAEEYGTYSAQDYRGLLDVQNQATPSFSGRLQTLIDLLQSPEYKGGGVTTTVRQETLKLVSVTDAAAIVTMTADYIDSEGVKSVTTVTVNFVRFGTYWQVADISAIQN